MMHITQIFPSRHQDIKLWLQQKYYAASFNSYAYVRCLIKVLSQLIFWIIFHKHYGIAHILGKQLAVEQCLYYRNNWWLSPGDLLSDLWRQRSEISLSDMTMYDDQWRCWSVKEPYQIILIVTYCHGANPSWPHIILCYLPYLFICLISSGLSSRPVAYISLLSKANLITWRMWCRQACIR